MGWLNIIFILYQIIAIIAVIHVIMDNRQPAKTMAWALVIWFVPVVGIVFYLFFGVNTRKERHVSEMTMVPSEDGMERLSVLMGRYSIFPCR